MSKLHIQIDVCSKVIEKIRGEINAGQCNVCAQQGIVCKMIEPLVVSLNTLSNIIEQSDAITSEHLKKLSSRISGGRLISPFDFGGVQSIVAILQKKSASKSSKKIFISHSSKDGELVSKFVDHVLQLGTGLTEKDIFCTSIEDMGVKNGEDIRRHIHDNIRNAEFSILMISNHYKESEICVNEMGAVWAYNNNVRFYMLPEAGFDKIGWLCDTKKADKINNATTLDVLHNEILEHFQLPTKGITWSRQRQTFLEYIIKLQTLKNI